MSRNGFAINGRAARAVAAQDRAVPSRVVHCPTCKAAVGEPCVTANGKPGQHPARRRMAIRALRDEQSFVIVVADLRYAQFSTPEQRRVARRVSKQSMGAVAAEVGVSYATLANWMAGRRVPTGEAGARFGHWLRKQLADSP